MHFVFNDQIKVFQTFIRSMMKQNSMEIDKNAYIAERDNKNQVIGESIMLLGPKRRNFPHDGHQPDTVGILSVLLCCKQGHVVCTKSGDSQRGFHTDRVVVEDRAGYNIHDRRISSVPFSCTGHMEVIH